MNISALADGSTSYRQGIQSSQALTKPQPWRFHLEERKQTPGPASKALPASVHLDRRHLERARNGLNSLFHDVALKKTVQITPCMCKFYWCKSVCGKEARFRIYFFVTKCY